MQNEDLNTDVTTAMFGAPCAIYTRAQALADGVLHDVTRIANEVGLPAQSAFTRSVMEWIGGADDPEFAGTAYQVLWMTLGALWRHVRARRFSFGMLRDGYTMTFTVDLSDGDDGEPVLTIGFPQDF